MQYTVASHGQPIGVTDLGFVRIGGPVRWGWFHPNAEGEQIMPLFSAVLPALRASVQRDRERDAESAGVRSHPPDAARYADLDEALRRVGALELTLHREDGSLVPTMTIGIQDADQLLALAESEDELDDRRGWTPEDDEIDRELDEWLGEESDDFDDVEPFAAERSGERPEEEEPVRFPRYQIHVELVDAEAIP